MLSRPSGLGGCREGAQLSRDISTPRMGSPSNAIFTVPQKVLTISNLGSVY